MPTLEDSLSHGASIFPLTPCLPLSLDASLMARLRRHGELHSLCTMSGGEVSALSIHDQIHLSVLLHSRSLVCLFFSYLGELHCSRDAEGESRG